MLTNVSLAVDDASDLVDGVENRKASIVYCPLETIYTIEAFNVEIAGSEPTSSRCHRGALPIELYPLKRRKRVYPTPLPLSHIVQSVLRAIVIATWSSVQESNLY